MRGEGKAQRLQERKSSRHVSEPQFIRHMHHARARVAGINSALGLRVCRVQSLARVCVGLD